MENPVSHSISLYEKELILVENFIKIVFNYNSPNLNKSYFGMTSRGLTLSFKIKRHDKVQYTIHIGAKKINNEGKFNSYMLKFYVEIDKQHLYEFATLSFDKINLKFSVNYSKAPYKKITTYSSQEPKVKKDMLVSKTLRILKSPKNDFPLDKFILDHVNKIKLMYTSDILPKID